jgi:hypothetical protein
MLNLALSEEQITSFALSYSFLSIKSCIAFNSIEPAYNWLTLDPAAPETPAVKPIPILTIDTTTENNANKNIDFMVYSTDKLDAQILVHYAEAIKSKLTSSKLDIMQSMSDLVARRDQLLVMQTMEKNRM